MCRKYPGMRFFDIDFRRGLPTLFQAISAVRSRCRITFDSRQPLCEARSVRPTYGVAPDPFGAPAMGMSPDGAIGFVLVSEFRSGARFRDEPVRVPLADGSDSAIGGYCPYGRGGKGLTWSLSQVALRELLVSITSKSGCAGRARAQAVDEPM